MQPTYFLFNFSENWWKKKGGGFDNTVINERIVSMRITEDMSMILIFLYKFGDVLYSKL